jgi:hypothetical protein
MKAIQAGSATSALYRSLIGLHDEANAGARIRMLPSEACRDALEVGLGGRNADPVEEFFTSDLIPC